MSAAATLPFQEVSLDEALTIIDEMTDTEDKDGSTRVVTGIHPTRGSIHVVIPPMGSPLQLSAMSPLVVQDSKV